MKINILIGTIFLPIKKSLKLKVSTEEQGKKNITCLDLVHKSVDAPQYSRFNDGLPVQ